MKLPTLARKREKEVNITHFGSLDMTGAAKDGDLVMAENMSVTAAPGLSVRRGRGRAGNYRSPTGVYSWNGLVVVDGGGVYYDGEPVGAVTEGPKQFAVVGDKLCIFPDKVYVNIRDKTFGRLDSVIITPWNGVTLTANTLKVTTLAQTQSCRNPAAYLEIPQSLLYFKTYTALSWSDGDWVKTGESCIDLHQMAAGQIIIPTRQDGTSYAWRIDIVDDPADINENQDGYYGVIKSFDSEYYLKDGVIVCTLRNIEFEVRSAVSAAPASFIGQFAVGDTVSVSGIITGAAPFNSSYPVLTANGPTGEFPS